MQAQGRAAVIVVSVMPGERDKVRALDAGADDYVVKPFAAGQLEARIRAVLRRAAGDADAAAPVTVGALTVDSRSRRVTHAGEAVELSPKEFDLLAYLAARAGTVVSKRELLTEVWQLPYGGSDKTVDVHLSWLRRKLGESAAAPRLLHTVRGVGVRLAEPGS
jgi:DNA-binding response OmpR family regulator